MFNFLLDHVLLAAGQVWHTFSVNWPFLIASAIIAALLKLYLKPDVISSFLQRHQKAGVVASTAVAVATPLCSCGTMAMILGMMANMMPWAPIVAFMVASPLTSPEEYIYSAGLFGWPFATAFFLASILLGLAGGVIAGILESRGLLKGQIRILPNAKKPVAKAPATINLSTPEPKPAFVPAQSLVLLSEQSGPSFNPPLVGVPALATQSATCGCSASSVPVVQPAACGCGSTVEPTQPTQIDKLKTVALESFKTGKTLLIMFVVFAFTGYFLNSLIPPEWITSLFGSGKAYGVPLAATLGLPFYINTEASLPLVRAMLDAGMSSGAALAFLISGAGTSIGAIAGALTIARWRVIAIVIGTLWVGSIVIGFAYNLLMGL